MEFPELILLWKVGAALINQSIKENETVYTQDVINQVWEKARKVPGKDGASVRKDSYDVWIKKEFYADHSSIYGWEIYNIVSKQKGGTDSLSNLQPLHWQNKRHNNQLELIQSN